MKTFAIDISICNGCYNCQIACKDEHVANDWTPYAKPQPETGHFWLKLKENIRGTVPKVKMHYVAVMCMHCDNPPCIPSCHIKDAIYKREDGLVIIDPDKCDGCRACVEACPYDAIYFNEDTNIAQKCTGCAHLLDDGWKEPRCVDACPTEALKFGEESDLKDMIAKGVTLNPELKTGPRVHYLNMPKQFVGGTVYDPKKEEIIMGAKCTLSANGTKLMVETDDFGDFWFEELKEGIYNLEIEAKGFSTKTFNDLSTIGKSVNLGDIPL